MTNSTPGRLHAGAAQADITPRLGTPLAGAVAAHHTATSVLDPLFAKAVVFEQDGHRMGIVSLDVTIVTAPCTERIRAAAERCGIDPSALMVHGTQTHSAPSTSGFMLDKDFPLDPEFDWVNLHDEAFFEQATTGAIDAVERAVASLRPARIGSSCATRDDLAFNRRAIRRDGTCAMPWVYSSIDKPLGQTDYRYVEGPIDPEVGVVWVQGDNMRTIALLLHYTCHPVNVFYYRGKNHHGQVSADWPGIWASELAQMLGEDRLPDTVGAADVDSVAPAPVGVVLNGCCGNINPWPAYTPDFVPDHERMGKELAETAKRALGVVQFSDSPQLGYRMLDLTLPMREIDADALAAARERIERDPKPVVDESGELDGTWYRAAALVSLDLVRRRTPEEPYEVQVMRIGDIGLVGLPGEPFVEGQLRLKIESPAYPTFVAHCTSHYSGYMPTRDAFPRGGHEADLSWWSRRAPDALDTVVDAATELLRELF